MTRVIDDEFNPTPEQAEYLSERASSAATGLGPARAADQKRDEERAELVRLRARVAELEAQALGRPTPGAPAWFPTSAQKLLWHAEHLEDMAASENISLDMADRAAILADAELVRGAVARIAELEAKVAAPPWETLNVLDGEIDRLQAEVDRCHALYRSLAAK